MPLIETCTDGPVGTIVLDHPERCNALSAEVVEAIVEALALFSKEDIRAVVIRARPGVKVWSAGHDVNELPEGRRDPLGWTIRFALSSVPSKSSPRLSSQ